MNAHTHPNENSDTARLAREIDEQRREIDDTLRALEDKLSSRELAREFMHYVGEPGREWAAALGSSVKANPVPTLLTAVSLAWLMMSDQKHAPAAPYAYGDAERRGSGMFREAASSARETADALREKAGELGDKATQAAETLGEKAAHARDELSQSAASLRDNFAHIAKEQPLALGAVGLALGALIGATLRTEDERGNAGEHVSNKGEEAARETDAKAAQMGTDTGDATEADASGSEATVLPRVSSTSQGPGAPVPGDPGLG